MNLLQEKPHYPFVFDHKPGFFLNWFLYTLFKRVRFDENMTDDLKQMHREGTVVYAIKYRGHLDYLLYHYRFRRSRLPYPKLAFDLNISMFLPLSQLIKVLRYYISYFYKHHTLPSPFKTGFFRDAIQQGTSALLCLVDPKGFARHFIHAEKDPIHFLIETQMGTQRPIYIVPQLILYKKTPEKDQSSLLDIFFGFKENIGFIRKIALFFRHHRRAFIDFGRPLNVKAYLEGRPPGYPVEKMAAEIRQMLIESIDTQKRVIIGPVLKSRQQVKERVLKDGEITMAIENMAAGNLKKLRQLRRKAGGYFDEIASDFNIAYVQFFYIALSWLWKKIFQGIDVDLKELGVVREWARRGPVIYVPSHKSHIDYLVLNYVLYQHNVHLPRVAAGKNLAFWPMGHIFRKSGAFFIRRTFKGAGLYTKVFGKYIRALLEEGDSLEFFIEGGRSRSGKLILPKIGFLSILIQGFREGHCDDLVFVPTSITYDRILEEKSYLREQGGATKEKENLRQFFNARRLLKTTYGKIYIRFAQPLSLKEYLAKHSDLEERAHRHLAFHLIQSINKAILVTPLALVALAILTKHRRGFHLHELTATTKILLRFIKKYQIPIAPSLDNAEKMVEETLMLLINRKVVSFLEDVDGAETFYYVDEGEKRELEYYKNSIIHFFISHAFVAVSLLNGTEEKKTEADLLADYAFLKNLFKNEFVFAEAQGTLEEVNSVISYFLDASFITRDNANGGYVLTRLGFDKLPIWAALAKTFLESYWIAARSFIQREKKNKKGGDILKNMDYLGLRFHKLGLIDHIEAVSHITFQNAMPSIRENILGTQRGSDESLAGRGERLSRFTQKLYELSHFRT
jgi:glycerol-3-phosphate O-acyltransferase